MINEILNEREIVSFPAEGWLNFPKRIAYDLLKSREIRASMNVLTQCSVISRMQNEGADIIVNATDGRLLYEVFKRRWYLKPWDASNIEDAQKAARALSLGVPVFAPFAYFYAMLGNPSISAIKHLNTIKGRPEDQVASITTTYPHIENMFDWSFYPSIEYKDRISGFLNRVLEIGPVGLRGPARSDMHALITKVIDYPDLGEVRTVQPIFPGYKCISNPFIATCLHEIKRDFIVATSPNISRNTTGNDSAPHWQIKGIQEDFGIHGTTVLLAHPKEKMREEKYYPEFSWRSSTTILDVLDISQEGRDKWGIALVRYGSWPLDLLKKIADEEGFVIKHGPGIEAKRLPQLSYDRPKIFDRAVMLYNILSHQ